MDPGREGLRPIVCMTIGMDCDQGLLKEVLRLGRTVPDSRETVPVVGAQWWHSYDFQERQPTGHGKFHISPRIFQPLIRRNRANFFEVSIVASG